MAWQYQIRFTLDIPGEMPSEVTSLLNTYNAVPMCQYDLFAGYCREAEQEGVEDYPLYNWTIDTITNPKKKEKYQKVYSIYVNGDEIYDKTIADEIEQELLALGHVGINTITKHDSNPANNPQPPSR
jgi:hypothetical protein